MKYFISSFLILLGVVYTQNLNQNIDQFKINSFVRPVAKDSIEVLSFLEISNNALQFLKKDGVFIFSEHGLSPDKSVSFVQNSTDFFYPKISGGCHTNRDIEKLLLENNFNLIEMNNIYLPGTQKFLGYNYWGKATV